MKSWKKVSKGQVIGQKMATDSQDTHINSVGLIPPAKYGDFLRIPQNIDKTNFRPSFLIPPQADIWIQAEIKAL